MRLSLIALIGMLVVILFSSAINAMPFDATQEATVQTMITGQAKLPAGVSQLEATIHYYPRHGNNQRIISHRVTSLPVANQAGSEDTIRLTWPNPGPSTEFTVSDLVESKPTWIPYDRLDSWEGRRTPKEIKQYLLATHFIDADKAEISEIAKTIAQGSQSQQEAAWRIATWVRSNIVYNLSTITKDVTQKASWVLQHREGVCDELSVLFIAMLRSIGIPARFVNGMVYNGMGYGEASGQHTGPTSGWGSHAWAEVWFPGTGWVPFDLTFAQFSWLDAGHIRVGDFLDIDETSVEYRWKGPDGLLFAPISISGRTTETKTLPRPGIDVSLSLSRTRVGPGSTLVVSARVSNPTAQWIPITLSLTKAPGTLGDNLKAILVPPNSKVETPFLITVPNLVEQETYTSTIEIKTSLGQQAVTSIEFGTPYPISDATQAMEELNILETESRLDGIPELDTHCETTEPKYNLLDQAEIQCEQRNSGPEPISGTTCLGNQCQSFALKPGEQNSLRFTILATSTFQAKLFTRLDGTTGDNRIQARTQTSFAPVHISYNPVFSVATLHCPPVIDYHEQTTIRFVINSTVPVQGVRASIEGAGVVTIPDFAGEYNVTVPITGSQIINDYHSLVVYATAYLPDGKRVEDFEQCPVRITGLPWWREMIGG